MFSTGQIIFAIAFIIVFIILMIFVYRKDLKEMKRYYRGVFWILIAFLLFIGMLFFIKFFLKE